MNIMLIVVLLATVLLFFYFKKLRGSSDTKPTKTKSPDQQTRLQSLIESGEYFGLTIDYVNQAQCCPRALHLKNEVFSFNNVPILPLDGCTKNTCRCKYIGLKNKRNFHRRENIQRREEIRFEESSDRRSHNEQRSNVWFTHEK
ncbi:MAG: hypothetical protein V7682_04905 [Cycloclasticus sp.]